MIKRVITIILALSMIMVFIPNDTLNVKGAESMNQYNLTQNDVLTIKDGNFILGGKPFVEISFNKFDLYWQLFDALRFDGETAYQAMIVKQEQSLKELSEMGFRSIRAFMMPWAPNDFKEYYFDATKKETIYLRALDDTLRICEKYDMKIV